MKIEVDAVSNVSTLVGITPAGGRNIQKMRITGFLLTCALVGLSCGQLPFQVQPKQRGFVGKFVGGSKSKGEITPLYRLNDTFIPSHYDIEVRVILEEGEAAGSVFTAPGKVRVVGVNQEQSSRIVMHADQLTINTSSVTIIPTATPSQPVGVTGFSEDDERDFFIIELERELTPQEEVEIYIEYVAQIPQTSAGLFRKNYETETGEIRRMAATQFQAVDFRKMTPGFDEPALKATFELTVIRKDNYTSLSNTEQLSSTPDPDYPGWVIDKYARTVKMSSYLVAIAVSDYGYAESFFGSKPARTYAPKHLISNGGGDYTAEAQAKSLSFFEMYYNETYKLSKMDSIAVPGYGGAMENWGLNVYGTPYILFFPGEDTESHRNLVTLILAHELGHQWFGNLVTNSFWNQMYLNEGVTTYVQYLGMEAVSPDLNGEEFAILDAVQYSLQYDAGPYTHPLSFNVTTPEEIDEMFSTITYEKGASVMRMVDGFLTRETVTKALQEYLKKMSYQGVVQEDLFESLQEAAASDNRLPEGLTMPQIMTTWTDQSGFPLVRVEAVNQSHVVLSQERFRNDGAEVLEGTWYVPITIVTEDEPNLENNIPQLWLEADNVNKAIEHDASKWIMINQNATGFYRVLYDNTLAHHIQRQLDTDASVISPLSRSQLLDDYFVLANEKYVNIQTTLHLTTYMAQETHFTVWSTYFEHFLSIYTRFSAHPAFPLLRDYLQPKVDAALRAVGVEESPSHTGALAILRADLLDWDCSMGSSVCYDYAQQLLAQWQASPDVPPFSSVDARATLECAIVAAGGQPAFDFVFAKYQEAGNTPDIQGELLSALTCATNENVIQGFLEMTLSPASGLLPTDATSALEGIASNPTGRMIILHFVSTNIDYIVDTIGGGDARPVGAVLTALAKVYSTQAQLDQTQQFIDDNQDKLSTIAATIRAVIGTINANIAWMDTTGFDIWMWMWFQGGGK